MTPASKSEIRAWLRQRIRELSPGAREEGSAALRERIRFHPHWRFSRCVLLFAPREDEPDVWPLLQIALDEGKEVALPAFDPLIEAYGARRIERPAADLTTGRYGIREPSQGCLNVPLPRLDLVLVPGLGFTTDGARLGRGAGFYDRLLAGTHALRFGVGLDIQIVPHLPVEPHDLPMDYVLTPSGIHEGPARRA